MQQVQVFVAAYHRDGLVVPDMRLEPSTLERMQFALHYMLERNRDADHNVMICPHLSGYGPAALDAGDPVWLEGAQRDEATLQSFLAATEAVTTKADLDQEWRKVAGDLGVSGDFLNEKVFTAAESDGGWPREDFGEEAFVAGVRSGVEKFIGEAN